MSTSRSAADLLTCPFCGSSGLCDGGHVGIRCRGCSATGPVLKLGQLDSETLWNNRAAPFADSHSPEGWTPNVDFLKEISREHGVAVRCCPFCDGHNVEMTIFASRLALACVECWAEGPEVPEPASLTQPWGTIITNGMLKTIYLWNKRA